MGRRADTANIVKNFTNVVKFPPPVTEGQQEWERRLAAELRPYLPEDEGEARELVATMSAAVERFDGQQAWERRRLACYILGMFPEDRAMARRIINQLSCEGGADGV